MLFRSGVVIGWILMNRINDLWYRPTIGLIIFGLASLQIGRMLREEWFARMPHSTLFAWCMGGLVGITTMLANAAGPVFGLFLIAIGLPKKEFVGTAAWFFLLLNLFKIPFSWNLGLIRTDTLALNAMLLIPIFLGLKTGGTIVERIQQRWFDLTIILLSGLAAVQLIVF